MVKQRVAPELDRELDDLPPELRWREWIRRIEAVLLASASPVPRDDLARVVGQGASVDLLVADLAADLEDRSSELAPVAGGWMLRSRPAYAPAIRAAADVGDQLRDLGASDIAVLAAIAYHQPVTRDGLKEIFGKQISRDQIGRLHARGLIGTGPRSPRRGVPYTFVTTEQFLVAFGLESLRDLPGAEQMQDPAWSADRGFRRPRFRPARDARWPGSARRAPSTGRDAPVSSAGRGGRACRVPDPLSL